jgi:hypothetical protein
MTTKLQRSNKDILFCGLCSKPVTGKYIDVRNKVNPTDKLVYHIDARACADAPHLKIEWNRKPRQSE